MKQRPADRQPAPARKTPGDARPVLVVGASGQLGTRVVRRLLALGRPVRAFVRHTARFEHLKHPRVQIVHGDLADAASVRAACSGAGAVVATANAAAPTHGGSFASVDVGGYAALIEACRQQGCGRLVFASVAVTPWDARLPLFRHKRQTEQRLRDSGHPFAVLQFAPFMDDWFALAGSALAARGDPAALVDRPWPFLQRYMGVVGGLVEKRGLALVPGGGAQVLDFLAVDDAAAALAAATDHPAAANTTLPLGGPENLSWQAVAALLSQVLARPVQVVGTPAWLFALQQRLMQPFSEAAANIMALNWLLAQPLPPQGTATAGLLGLRLLRAEDFLRGQAALPPRAEERR
ncbi:hypothetical protein IP87_06615 [beta proteobacterium AAP121]|nr:hypothetical protein IP80_10275 [beta proteobacterium AAP65]KPF99055.1 hypothetical protein IP87_06615 [beta proteobacterium AAP121]